MSYDLLTVKLEPQDSILFFTDGLSDARNLQDKEFEIAGLRELCQIHAGECRIELLGHIFNALQDFTTNCRQWDDMTAAVFHYEPAR